MNTVDQDKQACCKRNEKGGIVALLLVFLGAVFLLNNFNLLPLEIWKNLWKFWPVLLIAWGFQTLLGKSFFANLVVMAFTIIIVFLLLSYFNPNFGYFLNSLLQLKVRP